MFGFDPAFAMIIGYLRSSSSLRLFRLFHTVRIGKTAVIGHAGYGAGYLMSALMAAFHRQKPRLHFDALHRAPSGIDTVLRNTVFQTRPPDVVHAIRVESQHAVGSRLLQLMKGAGYAESKYGRIGKLGVFFCRKRMLHHRILACGQGHNLVFPVTQHHVAFLHRKNLRKLRKRLAFCLPERMAVRQSQAYEGLKRPVGRARGIVALRHQQIRIRITDSEDTSIVKDRLRHPVFHVAFQNPLHHAP